MKHLIRTGIGGWTYPQWRGGMFYPAGLKQADELAYATRAVGAIEINATFYRRQSPKSFAAWRDTAPDGFVFAVKGSRFVTNRKELASAGESLANFFDQGVVELKDKLGPIMWQLAATKRFDPNDVAAFLAMLPKQHEGLPLRHAIEIGHESFACAEFVEMARKAEVTIVFSDADSRTAIADRTGPFTYLRMQRMESACSTGYSEQGLDWIAGLCREWASGNAPAGLHYCTAREQSGRPPGEVFAFLINGAKERAPAAAMALAARLETEA